MNSLKVTAEWVRAAKGRNEKVPVLTAYDYPSARLLDEAEVPVLLVGDSVGMVVLGYPDTTLVTMEEMEHHVRAVARARPRALIVADFPFQTYQRPDEAVANGRRLIAAGAEAVKLEGGTSRVPSIEALVRAGIPVMGHVGMLPQSIKLEGGYKIKGKIPEEREQLRQDAAAIAAAGVFAMVLELVHLPVARIITQEVAVPTIGIGSGPDCDGQVLVLSDLVGGFPWFKPKFAESRAAIGEEIRRAAREFCAAVRAAK